MSPLIANILVGAANSKTHTHTHTLGVKRSHSLTISTIFHPSITMKFSAFALLFSTVSALDVNLEGSISTGSSLGKKILANARALNDNNNNGQYT